MSVSHPNVLCLKETFDEDDGVYLVLELASEGELFEHIIQQGKISEEDTRKVFVQLLQGLKYLVRRPNAPEFHPKISSIGGDIILTSMLSMNGILFIGISNLRTFFCAIKICR